MPFRIEQLDHVALHVADLASSTLFYRDVIGLPTIDRPAFSFPGAWFQIGRTQQLHLIGEKPEQPNVTGSRNLHFAIRVDDAKAAAEQLRARGINFHGPKPRPDGALQIFVSDPDGYTLELVAR
jgi:catechol 2,3-dioxygenase-like lactoylglutathione lyase family enzyme